MSDQQVRAVFSVEHHLPTQPPPPISAIIERQLRIVMGDASQKDWKMDLESIAPFSSIDAKHVNLDDLDVYFRKVAETFSQLTAGLRDYLREAEEDHELHQAQHMDLGLLPGPQSPSIQRLSRIAEITARFERELKDEVLSPNDDHDANFGVGEGHYQIANFHKPVAASSFPQSKVSPLNSSCSPGSQSNDPFMNIDRVELQKRGRGNYKCPLGLRCTKGGVKDGIEVEFARNSAFLAHIQKHEKKYECQEPNCPNPPEKRRFARPDGLKRHLEHVHGDEQNDSRQRGKGRQDMKKEESSSPIEELHRAQFGGNTTAQRYTQATPSQGG